MNRIVPFGVILAWLGIIFAAGQCLAGQSAAPGDAGASSLQNLAQPASIKLTGIPTDLAIDGDGYFILSDPTTGEKLLTRAGDFSIDAKGLLTLIGGLRVQGFNIPIQSGAAYRDTDSVGDLRLDKGKLPVGFSASAMSAGISNLSIDRDGRIDVLLTDGTQYVRGQILLQSALKPNALVKRWLNFPLYNATSNAPILNASGRPGEAGLGRVISGGLDTGVPATRNRSVSGSTILLGPESDTEVLVGASTLRMAVQASADLIQWTTIQTNLNGSAVMRFFDSASRGVRARFYRTVLPEFRRTDLPTDLAIRGQGYFVVRDPASGESFATRAGRFQVDANGFLTTPNGMRVQGYNVSIAANQFYPETTPIGDLKFDKGALPDGLPQSAEAAPVSNVRITPTGRIESTLSDGTEYGRGQILLQQFSNPFALSAAGKNLYRGLGIAGALPQPGMPITQGLGTIYDGELEYAFDIAW